MAVSPHRLFMGNAKFIAFEPGGNIGVGFGVHIRIDPQAHRCPQAQGDGNFAQHVQLRFTLHVEAANAGLQRLLHLGAGFAHA